MPEEPGQAREVRNSHAFFQYVGKTALTVRCKRSGAVYRFDQPGRTLAVDPRDRASVAEVPQLRQVSHP